MEDKVKDELELLYTYQVLISLQGEYENVKIDTVGELEKLMQIIQKCMLTTNFSADYIITNIFEILNFQDISINDLVDLKIDDLLKILFTDEEDEIEENNNDKDYQEKEIPNDEDKGEIITEFTYKGYYCIVCQNRNKYIVILNNGDNSDVIILNSIDEMFDGTFKRKLIGLKLHE